MWKPIDQNNLPKGKVLAAVVKDSVIVGEITFGTLVVKHEVVCCEDHTSWIFLPTHYFDPRTLEVEKPAKSAGIERLKSLILAAPKQTQLTLAATKGNCFQTCIAAIMNKGIEEVPALQEMDNAQWAAKFIEYVISQVWEYHGAPSFKDLDAETWAYFPFLIVGGDSPRGTKAGHAVIYFNGSPFWDPHPSGDFILKEKEAYLIRPKDGWGGN